MTSIPEIYALFKQFPSVQTDTRRLQAGDLFLALKGENFNGNLFAAEAISQGASYAIVDEDVPLADPDKIVRVDHVLIPLQR